jgi:hypothetical protein
MPFWHSETGLATALWTAPARTLVQGKMQERQGLDRVR